MDKFFMHRIKRTAGVFDKGIEVHDSVESAKQAYHAYLGAYAYGHSADTDYVQCKITDWEGYRVEEETWHPVVIEPIEEQPEE